MARRCTLACRPPYLHPRATGRLLPGMNDEALWAIVPVKPLGEGKSRLAPLLSRAERAALSASLFERTLAAVLGAHCIDGLVVVSRDPQVLALAAASGALALLEVGNDLNSALEQGRRAAVGEGAAAILVLPADLPGIDAGELCAVVTSMGADQGIVGLVPSATGGTNVLLARPPDALPFAYGPESCQRHICLAQARGLEVRIVSSPVLAFDVDLPDDLTHTLLVAHARPRNDFLDLRAPEETAPEANMPVDVTPPTLSGINRFPG